jgi:hypothetical protein
MLVRSITATFDIHHSIFIILFSVSSGRTLERWNLSESRRHRGWFTPNANYCLSRKTFPVALSCQ